MTKALELIGQKFSRLLVVKRLENRKNGNAQWECFCDCGNITIVSSYKLTSRHTTSCGCFHKEKVREINKGKYVFKTKHGEVGFKKLFTQYKANSKNNNREFSLTKEEFREITSRNCFYCGGKTEQISTYHHENKVSSISRENGIYLYNGIDRLDNLKGYSKDNCVPCCKICNHMKNDLSINMFWERINKIYFYFKDSAWGAV